MNDERKRRAEFGDWQTPDELAAAACVKLILLGIVPNVVIEPTCGVGAFVLAFGTLPFIWNVIKTWRSAPHVTVDDPWGYGRSLEWATSCPPPRHNFTSIPRIRSESPAFDLHHPEVAALDHVETDPGFLDQVYGNADMQGSIQEKATKENPE